MGGRALKQYGVVTEKKDTKTFLIIGEFIQEKILSDLNIESSITKFYRDKNDHGDLDLLIKTTQEFRNKNINLRKYIEETFTPKAIYHSGGVYSFDYDNFQIDFILLNENNWEVANVYFSYDPIGNLMGKTYHKFNLLYGWDGLYYKFRNFNGRNSQNILISKDPRKIFEFGQYDYDRYLQGFDTLEDIFQFIINSPYFDIGIFQYENLKHIDKKRNKKRKSYNIFLKYLEDKKIMTKFRFSSNKEVYITQIEDYFPEANLMYTLKSLEKIDNLNKLLSNKFNGNVIMEWHPELRGKELGIIYEKFKQHLGDDYSDYILNNRIEKIRELFDDIYSSK